MCILVVPRAPGTRHLTYGDVAPGKWRRIARHRTATILGGRAAVVANQAGYALLRNAIKLFLERALRAIPRDGRRLTH